MADNEATVKSLQLQQLRIIKDGQAIRLNIDFKTGIIINAHLTTFSRSLTPAPDLPANIQADIEHLWDDIFEYLHTNHFDLDLD